MADYLLSESKVFHLHKEEFLACFYDIAFSASVSRKFPGQFQLSLREKSKVPENVHRRCFWGYIWEQKVLSRQRVGKRKGLGVCTANWESAQQGTESIAWPFPDHFPFVTAKSQIWHVGSLPFTLTFASCCFCSLKGYSLYTTAGLKEPCSSAWMLNRSAFVQGNIWTLSTCEWLQERRN